MEEIGLSRTENTGKNVVWQIGASLLTIGLGLISRYVFNKVLGADYLGLSSLFASVLSVLSFADLGIANSFTFCLYKPIAQNNQGYICVLLATFKKIMRAIMISILVLGLCFSPFLRYVVKESQQFTELQLQFYYFLSLAEILVSYLCTYKVCYVSACQKQYKLVPIRMWGSVITLVLKLGAVVLTHSYTIYVLTGTLVVVLQQLVTNWYITKKFPVVRQLQEGELTQEDRRAIKRNIKAGLINKFAQISVTQTDSIIISAALSIGTLGRITNYVTLKTYIFNIISQVQTSAHASMGDVVATESKEKQLDIFYRFLLVSQLLISGAVCGLLVLTTPIVVWVFGPTWKVDYLSTVLMVSAAAIVQHTYALNILPTANGRLDVVAKLAFVEGAVNLAASLIAIKLIGLPGVYLGTVIAELAYYILTPLKVFPTLYQCGAKRYFIRTLYGMAVTAIQVAVLLAIQGHIINNQYCFSNIIILCVCIIAVFSGGTYLAWHRDRYFKELCAMAAQLLRKGLKK